MQEKWIRVSAPDPDLPKKAPDGTEDTQKYYKAENVSLGSISWKEKWGAIVLNDGTKVDFAEGPLH